MDIMNTVNEGYQITRKSWFSQAVYAIVFSFIFSLVIIPFAFLVAIGAVLRFGTTTATGTINITTFTELLDDIIAEPFFWLTIYLLMLVSVVLLSMAIGMLQYIGLRKYENNGLSLEDSLKRPFVNGRFIPFVLLGFLETILMGIVGGALYLVRDFLNLDQTTVATSLNDVISNFLTIENIVYLLLQLIIYLIVIPPFMISCLSIIDDKSRYGAFVTGWQNYFRAFLFIEGVTIVSLIPIGVIGVLVSLIGVGMSTITGFESTVTPSLTATELAIILSLSFVIILLGFLTLLFLIPLFLNSIGKGYEEEAVKH